MLRRLSRLWIRWYCGRRGFVVFSSRWEGCLSCYWRQNLSCTKQTCQQRLLDGCILREARTSTQDNASQRRPFFAAIGKSARLELLRQGIEGVEYAVGDCIWVW